MKKALTFLLAALLCLLSAQGALAETELLARTGMYNDLNVYRLTAPNGQQLYFTSYDEAENYPVEFRDVNFDGTDDLVVTVALGASNSWHQFFIWNGSEYEHVSWNCGDETGLPNLSLFPEQGLVLTYCNFGSAGLENTLHLYRWDGAQLLVVRYASTATAESGAILLRVFEADYADGEREDRLLFEQEYSVADSQAAETLLAKEKELLWDGIGE